MLETPNLKIEDDVQDLNNDLNSYAITTSSISPRNQADYHRKEWPQAPDPSKEYRIASRTEK